MEQYVVKSEYSGKPWSIENKTDLYSFWGDEIKAAGGQEKGPNPVQYLAGAVNDCITLSVVMIAAHRKMNVNNFKIKNTTHTRSLGHGKSDVDTMKIEISFDSDLTSEQREKFIKRALEVSTVYQTVAKAVTMEIKLV